VLIFSGHFFIFMLTEKYNSRASKNRFFGPILFPGNGLAPLFEKARTSRKRREGDREAESGPPAARDKATIVLLALGLFREARVGFRATPGAPEASKDRLGLEKAPRRRRTIRIGRRVRKSDEKGGNPLRFRCL